MQIFDTEFDGVKILQPKIFNDERGLFFESHNQNLFKNVFQKNDFVQDNESHSNLGVLRGLHFQKGKYAQAKLIRVIKGVMLDVSVDLRKNSPSFAKYFSVILSGDNKKQLYIPRGFAHGFIALSSEVITQYKCDNYYNKDAEGGIAYNDPDLAIDWHLPKSQLLVNERDTNFPTLEEYISNK